MAIASSSARLSSGAARTVHVIWPDFTQVTGNIATSGTVRPTGNGTAGMMATVTQGAPPGQGTTQYKGRRCWTWGSAVGGAGVALWFVHRLNPQQDATPYPAGLDDCLVTETRWLLAFDRPGTDLTNTFDLGVGISPGNNNQNLFNPAVGSVYRAGVQFGPGGPGKLRFRSRAAQSGVGPPAYSADFDTGNTVVAGFDEREWNWYGIRMVGGAGNTAGFCKALINGVLFNQFNMSVASAIFPPANAGIGGAFGHLAGITNQTNGTQDFMYIARGELLMAPDETSII